jgi:hypothetical protein
MDKDDIIIFNDNFANLFQSQQTFVANFPFFSIFIGGIFYWIAFAIFGFGLNRDVWYWQLFFIAISGGLLFLGYFVGCHILTK